MYNMPQEQPQRGYSSAERSVREIASHLGVSNIEQVCAKMRTEYVLEEWQLPALDSFQWKSLDAPIGLAVAVHQICQGKAISVPQVRAVVQKESSIVQDLDLHNHMMQSALLGLRNSFDEKEEEKEDNDKMDKKEEEKENNDKADNTNEGVGVSNEGNDNRSDQEGNRSRDPEGVDSETEEEGEAEANTDATPALQEGDEGFMLVSGKAPAENQNDTSCFEDMHKDDDNSVDCTMSTSYSTCDEERTVDAAASPPREEVATTETEPLQSPSRSIRRKEDLEVSQYALSISPTILLSAPSPNEEGHDSFHHEDKEFTLSDEQSDHEEKECTTSHGQSDNEENEFAISDGQSDQAMVEDKDLAVRAADQEEVKVLGVATDGQEKVEAVGVDPDHGKVEDKDSALTTDAHEEVLGVGNGDQEEMEAVGVEPDQDILEDKDSAVTTDGQEAVLGVGNDGREEVEAVGVEPDQEIVDDKDSAVGTDGEDEVLGVGNDEQEEVEAVVVELDQVVLEDKDTADTTDGQEEVLGVGNDNQDEMEAVRVESDKDIVEDKGFAVRIDGFQDEVEVMGVENGDQEDVKAMGAESDQEIAEDKDLAVRTDSPEEEEISDVGNDALAELDAGGGDSVITLPDANSDDEAAELEEATPTVEINITIAEPTGEEKEEEVDVDPQLVGETGSQGSSDSSSDEDTVPDELPEIPKSNEEKSRLRNESLFQSNMSISERHSMSDQEMEEEDDDEEMVTLVSSRFHHQRTASSLESLYYVEDEQDDEHTVITSNMSPEKKSASKQRRRRSDQDAQIQSHSIGKANWMSRPSDWNTCCL
eukprot:scaffold22653_cov119-Cylindrotheca_fusiformis.AAC.2